MQAVRVGSDQQFIRVTLRNGRIWRIADLTLFTTQCVVFMSLHVESKETDLIIPVGIA